MDHDPPQIQEEAVTMLANSCSARQARRPGDRDGGDHFCTLAGHQGRQSMMTNSVMRRSEGCQPGENFRC
jgi:hypothetical protein